MSVLTRSKCRADFEGMKLPISVVVIARNEERRISNCLGSVQWSDDLVVVLDPATTDNTRGVAEKLGAKVTEKAWMGFGAQKQFAVSLAKNDWILSLDSDEEAGPGLSAEIQSKFPELDPKVAYKIPRKSFHLGRWIGHGGWSPDYQVRLFNRRYSDWDQATIHEKVQAESYQVLEHPILHYLFEDLAEQIDTNNRYSGLLAEKDFQAGKRFSVLRLVFKPWIKFLEVYFLKMGFRDGLPGFIIAVGAGYSIFLRHSKLWELQKRRPK